MFNWKKRRFRANHFYAILSISLVLFLLGITGFLFFNGKKLAEHFKEDIEFSAYLKDDLPPESTTGLQRYLQHQPFVKSLQYVSKDQARADYMKANPDEDLSLLDKNVLPASFEMKFHSAWVRADSLQRIQGLMTAQPAVADFVFESTTVDSVDANVRRYGLILLLVSGVILLIGLTVIDSTVRLALYSQRMLIRSMQLVGATQSFIMRPFLLRGAVNGLVSGLIAVGSMAVLMQYAIHQLPELALLQDPLVTAGLFSLMILTGILFSSLSSLLATRKYLRMQLDQLY